MIERVSILTRENGVYLHLSGAYGYSRIACDMDHV